MLKHAKHSGNIMRKTVSTNASSFPCQLPDFGGLKDILNNTFENSKQLPSIEVITPSQSVLPEQETSVSSQGSKHKQNASYDPGWKYFHFIIGFEIGN